jgi:hypothetical protein
MRDGRSGWDRHVDEQRRAWLRLSPAERLRWLEQAKEFHRLALGAARKGASARPARGKQPSDRTE